ncbi:FHA domain-containing protein [Candidatus Leptofilum sp.]|uniref:FHA domain-containing protein n=1 Tax=Candidatus Leptofilum sp. TaxID=3241576 RepID=UPI003B5B80F1
MFRMVYRVGLFLGAVIMALFIGARTINVFDPYRVLTEELMSEVAAEPLRTVRLYDYSSLAAQLRGVLLTEQAAKLDDSLDNPVVATVLGLVSLSSKADAVVTGVETAVAQIAALDETLVAVQGAEALSRDLAQLRFYDMAHGDVALANLYAQSTAVSHSLTDVSEGLDQTATAVANVTNGLELPKLQQSLAKVSNGDGNLVSESLQSWIGLPDNLWAVQQKIMVDVAWLDDFEQQYERAKVVNDRWRFDTLRLLPPFVAGNYQPLLLGLIGSLLLALAGWAGSREQHARPQPIPRQTVPRPAQSLPSLAFQWADGRTDRQTLPRVGELTIGNIVIRRARVRYYLERLDNAFPAFLNGESISSARTLNDGDVLQIGELQTVFQLAA